MKRLAIVLSENLHHRLHPVWREVLDLLHKRGLHGATATRGVMGFGHTGKMHEALSPDVIPDLPITVEAYDEPDAIDRALPEVQALAPNALIVVHEVQVVQKHR